MLKKKSLFMFSMLIIIISIVVLIESGNQRDMQSAEHLLVAAVSDDKMFSRVATIPDSKTAFSFFRVPNDHIPNVTALHGPFLSNQGQMDEKVKFYAKTFGGTVFVTVGGEIVYSFSDSRMHSGSGVDGDEGLAARGVALKESFVGGRLNEVKGESKAIPKISCFRGNNVSKWKSNIPTYDVVNLGEVYDGIELGLKAYGSNVEKLFHVKPDANSDLIKVKIDGAKKLKVNDAGELEVETELGDIRFTKPVAYQEMIVAGSQGTVASQKQNRKYIEVAYVVDGDSYGFKVGSYDKSKELVIDPLLASTFIGGNADEKAFSIAIDPAGNVYVTGTTSSPDFPSNTGAYSTANSGRNIFIAKLDSDLTTLLAATYLGGSVWETSAKILIGFDGNIYVSGYTSSLDFPTTADAYSTKHIAGVDAFIAKLDSELTTLLASTFVGGNGTDVIYRTTIAPDGDIYVSGYTESSDFPAGSAAYSSKYSGEGDAFIAKLDSGLTNLIAATYIGGSKLEGANSIVLDPNGNVFIAGHTESADFPATSGAFDTAFDGSFTAAQFSDGFVAKFNGDLTVLLASTFLGGSFYDSAIAMGLDSSENVYVSGKTSSTDFPTTPNAYMPSNGDDMLVEGPVYYFISKLNNDLTTLLSSTYLGGQENVETPGNLNAMALDMDGNIYVAGETTADNFPVTAGGYDTSCGTDGKCDRDGISFYSPSDVFISKLDGNLTALLASTYLGGEGDEQANALAINTEGYIYIAGQTLSEKFPTTKGPYDTSLNGYMDAFVVKFDPELSNNSIKYDLNVSKSGSGSGKITSNPAGISCGNKCTGSYKFNKSLRMAAKPSVGSFFLEWGGACSGNGNCIVKMDSDKTVTATFERYDPDISLPKATLDFGRVSVNKTSRKKGLRINNTGKGILTISGLTIDTNDFQVANNADQTILPKSGASIAVSFNPTSTGEKTATLTITSDDPETPTKTVILKGTGK